MQDQAKQYERELEDREGALKLREKAFYLLEAVCPTSAPALPSTDVRITDQYFYHSKMLYRGYQADLPDISGA